MKPPWPSGKLEYWVGSSGDIIETVQNPCGCHSFDFLYTNDTGHYDKVKLNTVSMSFKSRQQFAAYMRTNHYMALEN